MNSSKFYMLTVPLIVGRLKRRKVFTTCVGLALAAVSNSQAPVAAKCGASKPCPQCRRCKKFRCVPGRDGITCDKGYCQSGRCIVDCAVAPPGSRCKEGTCQNEICAGECTFEADSTPCSGGLHCVNGSCVFTCVYQSDGTRCPNGICMAGICRSECTDQINGTPCSGGLHCVNGSCVFDCVYQTPGTPCPGGTCRNTQCSPTCDPSYPTVCIAPPPPDLDCNQIPYRNFLVTGSDPHQFDGDGNGIGCET